MRICLLLSSSTLLSLLIIWYLEHLCTLILNKSVQWQALMLLPITAITWLFNLHKIIYANLISPLFTTEAYSPLGCEICWELQHTAELEVRFTNPLNRDAPPTERKDTPALMWEDTFRFNNFLFTTFFLHGTVLAAILSLTDSVLTITWRESERFYIQLNTTQLLSAETDMKPMCIYF